jgi:hypothetical protein
MLRWDIIMVSIPGGIREIFTLRVGAGGALTKWKKIDI